MQDNAPERTPGRARVNIYVSLFHPNPPGPGVLSVR